jgi:hypothetical protein
MAGHLWRKLSGPARIVGFKWRESFYLYTAIIMPTQDARISVPSDVAASLSSVAGGDHVSFAGEGWFPGGTFPL